MGKIITPLSEWQKRPARVNSGPACIYNIFQNVCDMAQLLNSSTPNLSLHIKMGKRSHKNVDSAESTNNGSSKSHSKNSLLPNDKAIDPSLAALFASSVRTSFNCPKRNY